MCGICGIIRFDNQPVQEAPVRKMMQTMKHRGPDDEGVFLEENVGLGFVRLSIIDLSSAGHQPMFSHDEKYVIVYNGEIYNYLELRDELKSLGHIFKTNSDTEVLLTSYIEWGEECLHRFNGMWAFVIYDRINKSMYASRDRYGIKPFYYYYDEKILIFASEIPPILTLLKSKPSVNNQAVFDYLVFNRTDHSEQTFFKEIKKLHHGHNLSFNCQSSLFNRTAGRLGEASLQSSIKKWYNLREKASEAEGFRNAEEFRNLLSSSIGLRLRSDVPVGVCLSGGIDSSSIVSILLNDFKKVDLNTFSAVYKRGQHGDETEYIKEYSAQINNMFFTTPTAETLYNEMYTFIKAHAEPIPETGVYAQYKVMELAGKNVVVTLDGQGADEMLAGYHYFFGYFFKDLLKHGNLAKLPSEIFHYVNNHRSLYGIKTFAYLLLPIKMRTSASVDNKGYLAKGFVDCYCKDNSVVGALYNSSSLKDALLDHFEYKLEHLLKWEDRNSMWFSLEARVPFLDHRLVENTLAINKQDMISKGMTKTISREAVKGIVPEKIRLRKDKIGFGTPQDEWFRMPQFKKIIEEILSPGNFITDNLIDNIKASKLYLAHIRGENNISKEIWKWIHLELWHREFFG
jgi:asparagine synthase (glutamine-hydrolysing)